MKFNEQTSLHKSHDDNQTISVTNENTPSADEGLKAQAVI